MSSWAADAAPLESARWLVSKPTTLPVSVAISPWSVPWSVFAARATSARYAAISCGDPETGSRVGLRRSGAGGLGLARERGGVLISTTGTPLARGSCDDPAGLSEAGRDEALGSRPSSGAPPASEVAVAKLGVCERLPGSRPG
eukprot:4102308-Alexandrium_andersonii.AAC.1